jgi:hypothetical protein
MKSENWNHFLILGIIFTLVFIGLHFQSGPFYYRGLPIDVRIVRMVCLLIAIINFASYLGLKKIKKK